MILEFSRLAVSCVDHFERLASQLKLLVLRISCIKQSRRCELVVIAFFLYSCGVVLSLSEAWSVVAFGVQVLADAFIFRLPNHHVCIFHLLAESNRKPLTLRYCCIEGNFRLINI